MKKSTTKKNRITTAMLLDRIKMLEAHREKHHDRIEKLEQVPHTASSFEADMRAAFAKRGMDYDVHQAKKAARALEANSHPQRVEEEPWKPKVGEYVFIRDGEPTSKMIVVERVYANAPCVHLKDENGPVGGCFHPNDLRPATSKEITLYKQEVEWAKVSELQNYDACECTIKERHQLYDLFIPFGAVYADHTRSKFEEGRMIGAYWCDGQLLAMSSNDEQTFPFPEFLRRAKGTAARLKKEAQEKEEAKPLEFGTKVKHSVLGHCRVACFNASEQGSWLLIPEGANASWSLFASRHEFTII